MYSKDPGVLNSRDVEYGMRGPSRGQAPVTFSWCEYIFFYRLIYQPEFATFQRLVLCKLESVLYQPVLSLAVSQPTRDSHTHRANSD